MAGLHLNRPLRQVQPEEKLRSLRNEDPQFPGLRSMVQPEEKFRSLRNRHGSPPRNKVNSAIARIRRIL
jgi:hypothetical protein